MKIPIYLSLFKDLLKPELMKLMTKNKQNKDFKKIFFDILMKNLKNFNLEKKDLKQLFDKYEFNFEKNNKKLKEKDLYDIYFYLLKNLDTNKINSLNFDKFLDKKELVNKDKNFISELKPILKNMKKLNLKIINNKGNSKVLNLNNEFNKNSHIIKKSFLIKNNFFIKKEFLKNLFFKNKKIKDVLVFFNNYKDLLKNKNIYKNEEFFKDLNSIYNKKEVYLKNNLDKLFIINKREINNENINQHHIKRLNTITLNKLKTIDFARKLAKFSVNNKIKIVKIQLHPPNLGTLKIKLQLLPDNSLKTTLLTSNDNAANLLTKVLPELKNNLSSLGFNKIFFDVSNFNSNLANDNLNYSKNFFNFKKKNNKLKMSLDSLNQEDNYSDKKGVLIYRYHNFSQLA